MEHNPYASPQAAVSAHGDIKAWRFRKDVVIPREGGELPHRCIKCNAEAVTRKRVRLAYLNPWFYLLLLINLLVLLIAAAIFQKTVKVEIPLCEQHRRRRLKFITTMWLAFIGVTSGMAIAFAADQPELGAVLILVLLIVILIAMAGRMVYARKIDKQYAWIRGASPEYLEMLPEFPG